MNKLFLAAFLFAATVVALSNTETHKVLYHRTDVPDAKLWKLWKEASDDQLITFSLALKQRNLDQLEQLFWENADPTSPKYAKHMSRNDILDLIAPSEEVQTSILNWLQNSADELDAEIKINNMKDFIQVTAPAFYVNNLFRTNIHSFVNANTRQVVFKHLGTLSVPKTIAEHIELVTGITEFPPASALNPRKYENARRDDDNGCNVPYTIKKLYNVPQDLTVSNPSANVSIYSEYNVDAQTGEGFNLPDLTAFEIANNLPQTGISCIAGNGAKYYSDNGEDVEAILDVQMISGMAVGAKICFYIMETSGGWMLEFTNDVFSTPNAPTVISISYAWNENQQCYEEAGVTGLGNCTALNIPNSAVYVARTNVQFMKLGLAGFSVFVASGDDGTVGTHFSEDGCQSMAPLFPASSPYVTAVGATSIEPSQSPAEALAGDLPPVCNHASYGCPCSTSTNEQPALGINAAEFDTGGGFSNYNPMPDYQKDAVNKYLNSGVQLPPTYFNKSGRAYPDVSAIGEQFCLVEEVYQGSYQCSMEGGTSASAPLWAGLVTLLNQDRLNSGKTTLGFLNPVLYKMFSESTSKYFNNKFGAGNNGGECGKSLGFNSISDQWTPLTGLGSPKFDQIRNYIKNLQ